MRPHAAVALTVLVLGGGCQVEPELELEPLDAPRHERCTAMLECAQTECMTPLEAVETCYLLMPNCSMDVFIERWRDRTACLVDHDCNFTRCTVHVDGWDFECEDEAEKEILHTAISDPPWRASAEACAMLEDVDS